MVENGSGEVGGKSGMDEERKPGETGEETGREERLAGDASFLASSSIVLRVAVRAAEDLECSRPGKESERSGCELAALSALVIRSEMSRFASSTPFCDS